MSRAFVKEDVEAMPLVPRRAPLPEGTRNYVTLRGLGLLRSELEGLLAELALRERGGRLGQVEGLALRERIAELETRVGSAEPIDPVEGAKNVVRFGARVTIRAADGRERTLRIVGVDEADATEGRVAFIAPIAKALLGKRIGETAAWKTPRGDDELEVVAIDFEPE